MSDEQHDLPGVAIIGMAGRFPGSRNIEELWSNLKAGKESVTFFSDAELAAAGVPPDRLADPRYVKASAVLDDVESFDAAFFGFNPREAEVMDPQHRLFLECAWEALEDAGYDAETYPGAIGVYAGMLMNSYLITNLLPSEGAIVGVGELQARISNDKDFLTTRVSYKLNLRGPSIAVQTACSSSLVALHLAWQSLLAYQADMALAGGVSIRLPHRVGHLYQEGGIFSPDGHCRPFDAAAQGTVSGSGAGIVVLKRLEEALHDGDRIYAVIKGSALNNDGSLKAGFTAPSVTAQAEVVATALGVAGFAPHTIGLVEAHGTGTPLGDPIEVAALSRAFGAPARRGSCALGSIKSNFGHLDAAAGVAGLIKAALAVRDGVLPPSLHFATPNPEVDFVASPFRVQTELAEWPAEQRPRRAGVSSFGVGGTNAHAVLEEPPAAGPSGVSRRHQPILLSARTAAALDAATANLVRHLRQSPDIPLADVAYTLAVGRKAFEHRRAVVVCGGEAAEMLEESKPGQVLTARATADLPVVFLCPGQGAQYLGMGAGLYAGEPTFRQEVDRCAELLRPHLGLDLRQLIFARAEDREAAARRLRQTVYAQPALFTTEYALARQWMDWGVEPQALLGHSVGELVAACLAGVLSLANALELVALRGRLMQGMPPGSMLAVSLPAAELLPRLGTRLALAASNAPALSVASGPASAVDELAAELEAAGIEHRRLHTSHAFHSTMMEPALGPFAERVRTKELLPPRIPIVSNRTGAWLTAAEACDPLYWVAQMRDPVRFSEGVGTLLAEPARAFLEVGPGRTLATLVRAHLDGERRETAVLTSLRHPEDEGDDEENLVTAAARLWLAGGRVDWRRFYARERRLRVALPTYSFERQRYWIEPEPGATHYGRRGASGGYERPLWKQGLGLPPPREEDLGDAGEGWLIVVDRGGLGGELAERLTGLGRRVVSVPAEAAEQVESLASALNALPAARCHVVHLAGLDDSLKEGVDPDALPVGALALARALERLPERPLRLVWAARPLDEVTGGEALTPGRSALSGLARDLAGRLPHLSCRVVDLDFPGAVAHLLAELAVADAEPRVAWRAGRRWVHGVEPVRLGEAGENEGGLLRGGGTYWIAAGESAAGIQLAEALERIAPAGARVEVVEMREAVGRAVALSGGLHGVLWGPMPPTPAASPLAGEGEAAFRAAVDDLRAFGAAVAGKGLDFVLLLGSPAGEAAAFEAWADAFAALRNREGGTRWLRALGDPWWDDPAAAGPILRRLVSRHAADRLVLPARPQARPSPAAPGHARPELDTGYAAPRDEVERTIAGIWQDLLGVARIGVHDNFFELGGHSLLATRILARLREALRVEVPMRGLSEAPTVAELAALVGRQCTEAAAEADAAVPPTIGPDPAARYEPFPLTEVQQAYWVGRGEAFALGSVGTQVYFEIDSDELDLARYEDAWRRLIQAHDMLRAVVLPDGRQRVLPSVPEYRIAAQDLRGDDPAVAAAKLAAVREQMSRDPLPAERWPLFEVRASFLDGGRARVHIRIDNLLADAWSFGLLARDLDRLYRSPGEPLPEREISFRDYVQAVNAERNSEPYRRALAYWRARLDGLPPGPELPLASGKAPQPPRFVRLGGAVAAEAWAQVKARAGRAGVSPAGTVAAAFAETLSAWSKSAHFTLNLTLFNRLPLHPEVDGLVGDFTSVTLLEVDHRRAESFESRARRLQRRLWDDLDHRAVSGVEVLRELARRGEQRLMPVVFTSNLNLEAGPALQSAWGLPGRIVYQISQTPQVWLVSQAAERGGDLLLDWDVVEGLFPPGVAEEMLAACLGLIRRLAVGEAAWGSEERFLAPESQLARRAQINATDTGLPEGLLHEGLLRQAALRPGAPAILWPEGAMSYGELLRRAGGLARRLRAAGAAPGRLVAVVLEKGWEQAVAVYGTLLAGAAYLPLDPALPRERLWLLLEHGGVELALTQARWDTALAWPAAVRRLIVDAEPEEGGPAASSPPARPEDLAYVIYTSGSTGMPKGVMIEHRAALNTVADVNRRFAVGPEDRVLALSALNFDLSVYDLFGLPAAGGAVVLPEPAALREPARWAELLESARVTVWNTVPALLVMLVDFLEGQGRRLPPALRLVLLSGDWIPVTLPDRVRALHPGAVELVSLGGATEASIWSILYEIGEVDSAWRSIPYGRPMDNQRFHVLNEAMEPCPDWAVGHLNIGGAGLARGYWSDEARTREAFFLHPRTGERLYRTGDLGRFLPSGEIEFLGRDDFQVKVQGYRIELGEIEAALAQYPGVRAVAVAAPEGRRLVGYAVMEEGSAPAAEELRRFLTAKLPEYMVPPVFVFLPSLPLSANGKVERRALPPPEAAAPDAAVRTGEEPLGPVEESLAAIWRAVLERPYVGLHDNFHQLGGDSILATQVIARVREELKVELPLRVVYDHPTLAGMADAVRRVQPAAGADDEEARLAKILEQLDQLLPDQLEALLEEKRSAGEA
jgi:amino acid adenylation domain-containing protein